jgi:hypothetical protein
MKKKIIFVAGMHRSGTSIMTRGLSSIKNIKFSSKLIPPHKDNVKGYFEDQRFVEMNEYILKKLHLSWRNVDEVRKKINRVSSQKKLDRQLIHGCVEELRRIINQTNEHLVIKDPRFVLLIDFYFDHIFQHFSEEFLFIVIYRHPCEVIQSLMKRDKLTSKEAEILWCTYNTNLIKRLKVHRDKFFVINLNNFIDKTIPSFILLIKFIYQRSEKKSKYFLASVFFLSLYKIIIFRLFFYKNKLLKSKNNFNNDNLSKKLYAF